AEGLADRGAVLDELPAGQGGQALAQLGVRQAVFRPFQRLAALLRQFIDRGHDSVLPGTARSIGAGRTMRAMINISESAQDYFRRLLEQQGGDAVGIRISAVHPGTPAADARLEFCEDGDLDGQEWAVECAGFVLYVDGPSVPFLDAADIDFVQNATGGQLTIRAPRIKGEAPAEGSSLVEKVRWLIDSEINPQLAAHRGRVAL